MSAALVTLHDVTAQVSLVATAAVVAQTAVQVLVVIPLSSTNQPRVKVVQTHSTFVYRSIGAGSVA